MNKLLKYFDNSHYGISRFLLDMKQVAEFFQKNGMPFISRFIWRQFIGVCDYCGKWVGMNYVISRRGSLCSLCHLGNR